MKSGIKIDPATGQRYRAVNAKGRALLLNPLTNKGTAFTQRERDGLDLHGLMPPAVFTIKQQLERTYENYQAKTSNLEKYIYLESLHYRNETLYYRLLSEPIDEMMAVVYTPVMGEACQKSSHLYRRGRGLYISYEQRDGMEKILTNTEIGDPSIIVVTRERILGLAIRAPEGWGSLLESCASTRCAPEFRRSARCRLRSTSGRIMPRDITIRCTSV
jgi:hypothetical protein